MKKQKQHLVPQVYLKGFGFQKEEFGGKWFVHVKNLKDGKWQDREIKALLREKNFYDIEANPTNTIRILEKELHGKIETRFPKIITYLYENTQITRAIHLDIAETTANFLCRSKNVLLWIENILKIKPRKFWNIITEYNWNLHIDKDELFNRMIVLPEKDRRNKFMVYFMFHVKLILANAKLTVFKNTKGLLLFTNDNPVQLPNTGFGELVKPDFECFFALNPDLLAYFYWKTNTIKVESIKEKLKNDEITVLTEELYEFHLQGIIKNLVDEFIISPYKYSNN